MRSQPLSSDWAGRRLADRYLVKSLLGEGAAAAVFLAHDEKYGRDVAIKVLRGDIAAAVGIDRFQREISLAARLSHPHIVPLLDAGEADGLLYYVMPAVTGASLRHRLEAERQLPLDEALQVAHDVAVALDYAHVQGIVHRDIKPENVLLGAGTAVVTDFGIAKMLGEGSGENSLTRTGVAVGTVLYMSPEQASASPVDARSDVYALGCMVYEMLAGEPPFTGNSPQSVLAKHFTDAVPAVSRLRPSLPAGIDEAITAAMAKSPADRPARATDFVAALMRARHGMTASSTAAVAAATTRPSRERRRRLVAMASGVALAMLAGGLVTRRALEREPGQKSIAVLPFEDVSPGADNEYFATGIADELRTAFSRLPNLRVAARTSSFALRGTSLSTREIGERLNVASVLSGSIRRDGGLLRIIAELVDARSDSVLWHVQFDREVRDVFSVQEEIARTIATRLEVLADRTAPLVKASTSNDEAYQLYLKGRHAWQVRTPEAIREAIGYFQQAIVRDPGYASAFAGLADAHNVAGLNFYEAPGESFRLARAAAVRAIALDSTLAEAHAAYASVTAFLDRDWARADSGYRRAIALDPTWPSTYYFYSIFLSSMGSHDSAQKVAERAYALEPTSAVMLQGVGMTEIMGRSFARADSTLARAIGLDPAYYFPYSWRAIALARQGKSEAALEMARRSTRLAPENLLVRVFLGQTFALLGQRDSAAAVARGVEALATTRPIPNVMIGRLYAIIGDTARALAALERGMTTMEAQLSQMQTPGFESLRGVPRYEEMLRQLRLR